MSLAEQRTRIRDLPAGTRVGRYTLVRRLARGGMAEVFLALERGTSGMERLVALKLILPQMSDEARFVSMFMNEARVAAGLDHPSIAQVHDAGEADGEPFLAMEYVHGRTLSQLLREAGRQDRELPLGCAVAILRDACAALHYAHERTDVEGKPLHIVHRDVSPSNLMVRFDGRVKVLDFGIAKAASQTSATATGVFKGKAGYMSPEQCADEPLDRRSDVFNLGIMLYEATTGCRAFYADNPIATINKIAQGKVAPPSKVSDGYPSALEAIVMAALKPDPDVRTPTAESMQLSLEAFAREHRLDVSPVALAQVMEEVFGEVPYPAVPADLRTPSGASAPEGTAVAVPVDPPTSPEPQLITDLAGVPSGEQTRYWDAQARGRRRRLAAAGLMGVAAASVAWFLSGGGEGGDARPAKDAAPASESSAKSAGQGDAVATPPADGPGAPADDAAGDPQDAKADAGPAEDAAAPAKTEATDPAPVSAADDAKAPATKTKSKKKRRASPRRGGAKRPDKKAGSDPPPGMYP